MENNSDPHPTMYGESKCPFSAGQMLQNKVRNGKTNRDWWPNQLKLNILRKTH
jgi:catalase-peroxidase